VVDDSDAMMDEEYEVKDKVEIEKDKTDATGAI
jgi:hypothetical protein